MGNSVPPWPGEHKTSWEPRQGDAAASNGHTSDAVDLCSAALGVGVANGELSAAD